MPLNILFCILAFLYELCSYCCTRHLFFLVKEQYFWWKLSLFSLWNLLLGINFCSLWQSMLAAGWSGTAVCIPVCEHRACQCVQLCYIYKSMHHKLKRIAWPYRPPWGWPSFSPPVRPQNQTVVNRPDRPKCIHSALCSRLSVKVSSTLPYCACEVFKHGGC